MTHQQEREKLKSERKVTEMNTAQIVWYLTYKHRCFLLILSNLTTLAYVVTRIG